MIETFSRPHGFLLGPATREAYTFLAEMAPPECSEPRSQEADRSSSAFAANISENATLGGGEASRAEAAASGARSTRSRIHASATKSKNFSLRSRPRWRCFRKPCASVLGGLRPSTRTEGVVEYNREAAAQGIQQAAALRHPG